MKTLILTSAAALLAASTAMAHETFTDWDANQDEYIDRAEYDEQIERRQARGLAGEEEATGWWFDFDNDRDGMITRDEIDMWDADADGTITRDEYNEGMWKRFDADEDDRLSADEAQHMHGGSEVSQ